MTNTIIDTYSTNRIFAQVRYIDWNAEGSTPFYQITVSAYGMGHTTETRCARKAHELFAAAKR